MYMYLTNNEDGPIAHWETRSFEYRNRTSTRQHMPLPLVLARAHMHLVDHLDHPWVGQAVVARRRRQMGGRSWLLGHISCKPRHLYVGLFPALLVLHSFSAHGPVR